MKLFVIGKFSSWQNFLYLYYIEAHISVAFAKYVTVEIHSVLKRNDIVITIMISIYK